MRVLEFLNKRSRLDFYLKKAYSLVGFEEKEGITTAGGGGICGVYSGISVGGGGTL